MLLLMITGVFADDPLIFEPPIRTQQNGNVESAPNVIATTPEVELRQEKSNAPPSLKNEQEQTEPEQVFKAPANPKPWKGLFFDNDFSYKNDPHHTHLFGEAFKDISIFADVCDGCSDWWVSFGGELRFRHMNEDNRLRPGGPGKSTYDLWRWRNYLDVHYTDRFRLYIELLDASIFNQELPITPIDLNRWNIQNAFVDIAFGERDGNPLIFRAGRFELLFGSQRLVSPLNWSNTRRNFEGFQVISKGSTWDFDLFTSRPVNTGAGNGPLSRFNNEADRADASRTFNGAYTTYHGFENQTFDFYWLWLREQEERANVKDGSRHTIGARWGGTHTIFNESGEIQRTYSWDIEGGYQFGHEANKTVKAGFFTAILGHTWDQRTWKPKLSAVYYWGSGDRNPNDNEDNTFSVLFPLGHAYWGLIDNLSGQNLNDYSLQMLVHPTKKMSFLTAMHWFDLDRNTDFLYNVAGVPVGKIGSGTDVGEEFDMVLTYNFNPNFTVQAGYLWFWYGAFVENSLPRPDANQFYLQSILRY